VLADATHEGSLVEGRLSNGCQTEVNLAAGASQAPVVASIYQLDGMVRRASSLQMTADSRALEMAA
jgi:NADH-quinone oxidoreductase subunit G